MGEALPEYRWPWLVSGISLIAAALTGAAATYLWWLPCQGRLLVGTPLGPRFSDSLLGSECIDRMNEGTPFPLTTEAALSAPGLLGLAIVTMVLVAVSWLVPVLAERLATEEFFSARRVAAALPAVAILVVGVLGIGIAYRVPGAEDLAYALDTVLHLLIVVALIALLTAPARHPWRYVVAALALSSMGFFGPVIEYVVMVHWSEANWDAPPGSGYLSTGLMLFCGTALLIMTAAGRWLQPELSPSAPEQVQQVQPIP